MGQGPSAEAQQNTDNRINAIFATFWLRLERRMRGSPLAHTRDLTRRLPRGSTNRAAKDPADQQAAPVSRKKRIINHSQARGHQKALQSLTPTCPRNRSKIAVASQHKRMKIYLKRRHKAHRSNITQQAHSPHLQIPEITGPRNAAPQQLQIPAPSTDNWAQSPAWLSWNTETLDIHSGHQRHTKPAWASRTAGDALLPTKTLLALSGYGDWVMDNSLTGMGLMTDI
ncbi:Hypothetical predicted protein [Pelobates cultripes]|uniref:Uncharacterized protein n=1 Tax=Pelobates cultripes TaxID=61616 RepID=A0AAD1S3R6_PELCU|nr:Hypothetical predicted protein [Pelobates cultripes]